MPTRVRDLYTDPVVGALVVANGDLVLCADQVAVNQGVRFRIGFFLGEWFLDESIGLPYIDRILIKNPNLAEITDYFRTAILNTPDMVSVDTITIGYSGSRKITCTFTGTSSAGQIITGAITPLGS